MDFFCKVEKPKIIFKEKEKIFYVDKYRPESAKDFIIHSSIVNKLCNLLSYKEGNLDIINLFLYGQPDSGKYCLARAYIENYFEDLFQKVIDTFIVQPHSGLCLCMVLSVG